jgi:DnaK suppressor protein
MKTVNATNTNKANPPSNKQLRRILESKSTELRTQLRVPTVDNPMLHAIEDPYDSGDWAGKSHEEWIFLQKNSVDRAALREIEDALDRLRDGSYGTCLDCGISISRKRLDAVPWARYCVTCQERRQSGNN